MTRINRYIGLFIHYAKAAQNTMRNTSVGKPLTEHHWSFICQEHIQHNVQEVQIAYDRCEKAEVQH